MRLASGMAKVCLSELLIMHVHKPIDLHICLQGILLAQHVMHIFLPVFKSLCKFLCAFFVGFSKMLCPCPEMLYLLDLQSDKCFQCLHETRHLVFEQLPPFPHKYSSSLSFGGVPGQETDSYLPWEWSFFHPSATCCTLI